MPHAPADAELEDPLGPTLIKLGLGIALLVGGLAALGLVWREELEAIGQAFVGAVGGPGVMLGFFIPDAFTVPLPHEAFLTFALVGGLEFWEIVAWASFGSLSGGCVGYWLSRLLSHRPRVAGFLDRRAAKARRIIARHGKLGLALGAVTPLPYSLVCWACGMLGMRFLPFALVSLLRVPRVIFYLWLVGQGLDVSA